MPFNADSTLQHAMADPAAKAVLERNIPARMLGDPPLTEGPLKGVTVDLATLSHLRSPVTSSR